MPAAEPSKLHGMRSPPIRATFAHFFRERGTHLAAMVAYFALASFVPLIFLALSVLGFLDQADASSALVSYLKDDLPGPAGGQRSSGSSTRSSEREDALDRRRRRAALELGVAVLRARVGVQHHLRASQPDVPARQALAIAT